MSASLSMLINGFAASGLLGVGDDSASNGILAPRSSLSPSSAAAAGTALRARLGFLVQCVIGEMEVGMEEATGAEAWLAMMQTGGGGISVMVQLLRSVRVLDMSGELLALIDAAVDARATAAAQEGKDARMGGGALGVEDAASLLAVMGAGEERQLAPKLYGTCVRVLLETPESHSSEWSDAALELAAKAVKALANGAPAPDTRDFGELARKVCSVARGVCRVGGMRPRVLVGVMEMLEAVVASEKDKGDWLREECRRTRAALMKDAALVAEVSLRTRRALWSWVYPACSTCSTCSYSPIERGAGLGWAKGDGVYVLHCAVSIG